jgi:copper chaperone CopZ
MKNILSAIIILLSIATQAQVTKVYFQASGLTCSMCSNSINKSLRTLDFIDKIDADVKNYTFELSFKPNSNVDFDRIRKKVEDAGFSVSGFYATIYFDNIQLTNDQPVKVGSNALVFVKQKEQTLKGEIRVKIVDKGFVTSKEYRNSSFSIPERAEGIYHVSI